MNYYHLNQIINNIYKKQYLSDAKHWWYSVYSDHAAICHICSYECNFHHNTYENLIEHGLAHYSHLKAFL